MDTPIETASFIEGFTHWFKPEPFHRLARQTGFVRRQAKIDPYDFLLSLVLGQASALRLTLISQARSLAQPVSRQAIDQRYHERTVAFFHAAFDHTLAEALGQPPTASLAASLREHFAAVYLLDSTCFDVPPALQNLFPSCGGDGSPANVKLLLRYEYIQGQFDPHAVLLPGKKSDQGLAAAAAGRLKKDELQIQDKGFYDAAAWHAVQATGAYVLMPWTRSVTVWTRPQPGQPEQLLDVAAALGAATDARVEWTEVTLGKAERRVEGLRLTAFRLSPESAGRHRAAVREAQRTQGREPSKEALELAGWLILITNAPLAKLPTRMIAYLYRVRWQIELIFRQCKSTLRLDQARGDNPHRTQCEIWARLLCAVFVFLWHTHANAICWLQHRMEISFEQTACTIQQKAYTLGQALFRGGMDLDRELRSLWKCLLATARKGRQKSRTNSWDALNDLWLDPKPTPPAPASLDLVNP
jgi:hypothetical protein